MSPEPLHSIGALAKACGIPASTLRTWERRYGVPAPARSEGGQRVYQASDVEHLTLVAQALRRGHRPGQVVPATSAELRRLLGLAGPATLPADSVTATLLAATAALDDEGVERQLRADWGRRDALSFLDQVAAPYLRDVGTAWAAGELTVFQEHYGSERLRGFLEETWRPLARVAQGPKVVLAALPGEQHVLGLHMVAVLAVLAGHVPVFLGADCPLGDLAGCATQAGARAVMVSVPEGQAEGSRQSLAALRDLLPAEIHLVAGGRGAPDDVPGVHVVRRLAGLQAWFEGRT